MVTRARFERATPSFGDLRHSLEIQEVTAAKSREDDEECASTVLCDKHTDPRTNAGQRPSLGGLSKPEHHGLLPER